MFDKLIDSTPERRKRRFLRFFFGTSLLYLLALTAALVVSVVAANPEMMHPSDIEVTGLVPPPRGNSEAPRTKPHPPTKTSQPDINNPVPLEQDITKQAAEPAAEQSNNPPTGPLIEGPGDPRGTPHGDPHSPGFISGIGNERRSAPPEPPEPPPLPVTASKQPKNDTQSMLKVPSTVLQGKAIDRRTPVYPRMAIQVKLEGSVSVEVVISPEGRVEAARAVSGHPLLKPAAVEAAQLWRFQPTLLNGSPVRVTGIITFVFKLN